MDGTTDKAMIFELAMCAISLRVEFRGIGSSPVPQASRITSSNLIICHDLRLTMGMQVTRHSQPCNNQHFMISAEGVKLPSNAFHDLKIAGACC